MYAIRIEDAPIGSILSEPVTDKLGVLIVDKNTILNATLKNYLKDIKVKEVSINGIFNEDIDKDKIRFGKLDNFIYLALKRLDLNEILLSSRVLINNLRKDKHSSLLNTLQSYDDNTYTHSFNVACYSITVGIALNYQIGKLELLATGALLHDIGKLNISYSTLNKPSKLDYDEMEEIKKHPIIGKDILNAMGYSSSIIKDIVFQHHEDWNGLGYTLGLKGNKINDLAMIVHICDVYDALSSKRSYKNRYNKSEVWRIMDSYSGNKFSSTYYRVFKKHILRYFIGEEIHFENGEIAVVIEEGINKDNPKIYVNGKTLYLKDY